MPIDAKLRSIVQLLGSDGDEVYVTDLAGDKATIVVRRRVSAESTADRTASDLRLKIAEQLARDAA